MASRKIALAGGGDMEHAGGRPQASALPQILRQTVAAWSTDGCMKMAAALACYAVLSLAPLLVILFKIVTFFLRRDQSEKLITQQSQTLLGSAGNESLIQTILDSSRESSGIVATVISLTILIFGASGVFGELQDSMNRIWHVKLKPHGGIAAWVRRRFISMGMVLGVGFLLLVSFFVSTILTSLSTATLGDTRGVGIAVDILVSLIIITLLMAMIFKFLPDARVRWRDVWLGAFVTAALFLIGKWGLTLYFTFGAPTSAYGIFGSVLAVVIWVYYAAQILFFGAEFTRVQAQARGERPEPKDHAEAA
jgi:membrane protein